jgi:hypothetical protein
VEEVVQVPLLVALAPVVQPPLRRPRKRRRRRRRRSRTTTWASVCSIKQYLHSEDKRWLYEVRNKMLWHMRRHLIIETTSMGRSSCVRCMWTLMSPLQRS